MKSVLISIKPNFCELIASGKKTVEVRKNKPKLDTPFKVYIYCTKSKREYLRKYPFSLSTVFLQITDDSWKSLNGKVIGEFVCDEIKEITANNLISIYFNNPQEKTCLNDLEVRKYANGKNLFLWHISNLVIYDKPKKLGEFYKKCEQINCDDCPHLHFENTPNSYEGWCEFDEKIPIIRPPQSWCYVEEIKE